MFYNKVFYDADGTEAGGGSISTSAGSVASTAAAAGNDAVGAATGVENTTAVAPDAGQQGEVSKEIVSGGVKLVIDPNGKRRVVTVTADEQSQAEVAAKTPAAATGTTAIQQNGTVLPGLVQPQPQAIGTDQAATGVISDVLVNANGGEAAYSSSYRWL